MAQRVLIVPDKFKGTLTAPAAASHMQAGWLHARPQDDVDALPMSDGGDGFGAVLGALVHAETRTCTTLDAANRPRQARWWWDASDHIAIVESAEIVGLALLPRGQFHPYDLTTRGLAKVLLAAAAAGARSILVGIGGTATNDGGFGLAQALGWTFRDAKGNLITKWPELDRLATIEPPPQPPTLPPLHVAVDVQNPLLGTEGASRIYGPQKGLRPEDMQHADVCLGRLAEMTCIHLGRDHASVPGTGAAGGLGFGLMAFLGAQLEPGFERFAVMARLRERIRDADLVVSGEGCIDASTLMGKGVGGVAILCREAGIPCLGLAGMLGAGVHRSHPAPFTAVRAMAPELTSATRAQAEAGPWLEKLAQRVALEWCDSR